LTVARYLVGAKVIPKQYKFRKTSIFIFLYYQQCLKYGVACWHSNFRASDLQPIGRRFDSRSLNFMNDSGRVVHTHVPVFTKQYKLVQANGRKCSRNLTVGLALHWPHASQTQVLYPRTGSMA